MMQKPSEMKAQTLGKFCIFVLGFKEDYPTMKKWNGLISVSYHDIMTGKSGKTHLARSFLTSVEHTLLPAQGRTIQNEGLQQRRKKQSGVISVLVARLKVSRTQRFPVYSP